MKRNHPVKRKNTKNENYNFFEKDRTDDNTNKAHSSIVNSLIDESIKGAGENKEITNDYLNLKIKQEFKVISILVVKILDDIKKKNDLESED